MSQHAAWKVVAVGSHVTIQVAALGESCIANLALIRFFPGVGTVMLGKGRAIGKPFPTGTAFVGAISRVCPHVSCHRATLRETTVAYGTFEGFFSAVGAKMSSEISSLSEGLLADGALVRFFSRMGA